MAVKRQPVSSSKGTADPVRMTIPRSIILANTRHAATLAGADPREKPSASTRTSLA